MSDEDIELIRQLLAKLNAKGSKLLWFDDIDGGYHEIIEIGKHRDEPFEVAYIGPAGTGKYVAIWTGEVEMKHLFASTPLAKE
jgi:hypothetical protein